MDPETDDPAVAQLRLSRLGSGHCTALQTPANAEKPSGLTESTVVVCRSPLSGTAPP